MELTIQNGKPEDLTKRAAREIRCYEFLDKQRAEYVRIDHEHVSTIEEAEGVEENQGV